MLGIQAIGVALGQDCIGNVARAASFESTQEFIEEKIGFTTLRRLAPGQDTLDLCLAAHADLCTQVDVSADQVDCLIVVTQNPHSTGLPHTSAWVQQKLGLGQHVAAFDISLGCSGFVYGLSVIESFMQANGLNTGLLITADPYSKIIDKADRGTELIFGDAATCTLISRKPVYTTGKYVFASMGEKATTVRVKDEDHKLFMDGRAIFNFCMLHVPTQVEQCLQINNLSKDCLDACLLHQASRFIVENLARRMALESKTPFVLGDVGNCVSSTLPILLKRNWGLQTLLLCGFGMGLSSAATILNKTGD